MTKSICSSIGELINYGRSHTNVIASEVKNELLIHAMNDNDNIRVAISVTERRHTQIYMIENSIHAWLWKRQSKGRKHISSCYELEGVKISWLQENAGVGF